MGTFLSGAAIIVAFCALLYAASLGRKLDDNPADQVLRTVERLDKMLEVNEKAYDELLAHTNKLSDRLLILEKAVEEMPTAMASPVEKSDTAVDS